MSKQKDIDIKLCIKTNEKGKETLFVDGTQIATYTQPNKEVIIKDTKSYFKVVNKEEVDIEKLRYLVNQYFLTYIPPEVPKGTRKQKESIKCSVAGCGGEAFIKGINYFCNVCNSEYKPDGEPITPPWGKEPTHDEWIECTGQEAFEKTIKFWNDHIVYQTEIEYLIDTLWDAHTYFMKDFNSTPYRSYLSSGNAKGKTRALQVHSLLCYRPAFQSRPTDPCVKRILTDGGTLILDQAEDAFFKRYDKTIQYNIFTSGYKRGIQIGQLSATDHYNYDCKETFGAKCYCMQEDGRRDMPINRRSIKSMMAKGTPKNKDLDIKEAEIIRKMWYYLKTNLNTSKVNKNTSLDGDIAELIDPLIIVSRILGLPIQIEDKLYVYALELSDTLVEEAADTLPVLVLNGITATMKNETEKEGTTTPKLVSDWIIFNYPDITKSAGYRNVGKLMNQMGLKGVRDMAGIKYNMISQDNLKVLDKAIQQYKPESISGKLLQIERELEAGGYEIPDKCGSVYERFVKIGKLKSSLDWFHKQQVDLGVHINIEEPEEPEPEHPCPMCEKIIPGKRRTMCEECVKKNIPSREFEYHCTGCDRLIVGTNPKMTCDICDEKIKEYEKWSADQYESDPLAIPEP